MSNLTPEQIKSIRLKAGLTQEEAAQIINIKHARNFARFEMPVTCKQHRKMPKHKEELFLLKIEKIEHDAGLVVYGQARMRTQFSTQEILEGGEIGK